MRLGRLLIPLVVVNVVLYVALNGILAVLLPAQVAVIDPEGKVGALAVVTSISFAVTAVSHPVLGALSDRTRSRLGRRIPWMLGGAVIGGAAVGLMGGATSVVVLAVLWALGQALIGTVGTTGNAYLVDAVPRRRRGAAAGALGIGAILGGAAGAVAGGLLVHKLALAYVVLGAAVLLATIVFAIVVRDRTPPPDAPRQSAGAFLRGFVVDPRRHPAFAWLFAWRLTSTLGMSGLQGYLLYLFTDYLHVGKTPAAALVGAATVLGAVFVVLSVVVGGWLSDRSGRRKPFLVVGSAVVAVAAVVPLVVPAVGAIFVLAAAIGVGLGLSVSVGSALAAEVLPEPDRHAARGLSLLNLGSNIGQALAPLAAAAVIGSIGGYPALFAGMSLLLVAAVVLLLPLREVRAPVPASVPLEQGA